MWPGLLAAFVVLSLLIAGLVTSSALAACPNEDIRKDQGVTNLPACMALEMVSPAQKTGQPAFAPTVSDDGSRVLFFSVAALGGTPGVQNFSGDPYVAERGESGSGWTTKFTALPAEFVRGWNVAPEAKSFSPDLSSWLQIGATLPQYQQGAARAFQGQLGGMFAPLSRLYAPLSNGETMDVDGSAFAGASVDHSHLYFVPGPFAEASTAYLPTDPEPTGPGAMHNTYIARLDSSGEPSLELLARDSSLKAWGGNCGASLGGLGGSGVNQGAISANGARTYFSTRPGQAAAGGCDSTANKLRILVRTESASGPQIAPLFSGECTRVSPPCDSSDGNDMYQGASVDQTKVYFTSTRQLANSDLDTTSDLYLYDWSLPVGNRLIQVSAGASGDATPGSGANVSSVSGISGDGSHVYFVSNAVLTTEKNSVGGEAHVSSPNLYLYEPEDPTNPGHSRTAFIGTVGSGVRGFYPVPVSGREFGVEVGGDGHSLFFDSSEPLVPAEDADSSHLDIYRYNADASTLRCISCRSSKSSPSEPDENVDPSVSIRDQLGTDFAEQIRWVSEDGDTVSFTTAEKLVPDDANSATDSYLWHEGQFFRLPGTSDETGKLRDIPVLSHNGSEVAFQSFSQLLPQDGDSAKDIYVARTDGGFPNPPPKPECVSEGCQPPPPPPPVQGGCGSACISGPGNPKPHCRKGRRQVKRHGKVSCVKPKKVRHGKHHHGGRNHKQGGRK